MFASIDGFLFNIVAMGGLLIFAVVKIVAMIDDDGEIKKTAKDGFAECSRKLCKK